MAIQAGNPELGSGAVAAYCGFQLYQNPGGDGINADMDTLFSDRETKAANGSSQPFDATQSELDSIILTLDGKLEMGDVGGIQSITLNDLGNNILGGFGQSIGNKNIPAFWTITANGKINPIN
jgi:hypothetical protein